MKIKTQSTQIDIISGFSRTSSIKLTQADAVKIRGMRKAYDKLRNRIKREGLYSMATIDQVSMRFA